MKKLILLASCCVFLSACAYRSDVTLASKRVTEAKLADNSLVKIGTRLPEADWQCMQLLRKTQTWAETQFKGQFTFGGAHSLLQKQAIEYADKNHIKANYIVLKVPEQKSINDTYLNPTEDALIYYYVCKNPPALSNKIF